MYRSCRQASEPTPPMSGSNWKTSEGDNHSLFLNRWNRRTSLPWSVGVSAEDVPSKSGINHLDRAEGGLDARLGRQIEMQDDPIRFFRRSVPDKTEFFADFQHPDVAKRYEAFD